jgi:hypothetical protein
MPILGLEASMPVNDALVQKLRLLSGQPPAACLAALKKSKGDIEKALQHLVNAGKLNVQSAGAGLLDRMFGALSASADDIRKAQLENPTRKPAKPKPRAFPPFPELVRSMDDLEGEATFPSWVGYMDVRTSPKARPNATGRVALKISSPEDATSIAAPLPEQSAAFQYLKDHEQEITAAILKAVLPYYLKVRTWDAKADDPKRNTPKITSVDGLKSLMGPYQIDFRPIAKSGLSYVGFSFDCTWDPEHGLGVLTHKSRVILVDPDAAFDNTAAEKDGGKHLNVS